MSEYPIDNETGKTTSGNYRGGYESENKLSAKQLAWRIGLVVLGFILGLIVGSFRIL